MTDARRRQRPPRRALKRHPSPAKCEIVHRRPLPDTAPVSLSDPFGPLRGRRDGSARDRPRSAHQRRERRWADAHVARKDLSLTLGLLWLADAQNLLRGWIAVPRHSTMDTSKQTNSSDTPYL